MSERPSFLHGSEEQRTRSNPVLDQVLLRLRREGFEATTSSYDEELFFEAYKKIQEEFERADLTKKRTLLTDMFFDCLPPNDERHGKTFEQEFVISAPTRVLGDERFAAWGAEGGPLSDLDSDARFTLRLYEQGRASQYGPIKILNISPGAWGAQNRDNRSLLATANLSACQAIVGRSPESVVVAHSIYRCEDRIPLIMQKFRNQFGSEMQFDFFYPSYDFGGGDGKWATPENAQNHNRFYQDIAEREGMNPHGYYFVRADHNPDDVGASAVLVGPDMLRVVGYRMAYNPSLRKWEQKVRTVEDYD